MNGWALSHLLFRFLLFEFWWIAFVGIFPSILLHLPSFSAPKNESMALNLLGQFSISPYSNVFTPAQFVHGIGSLNLLGVILQIRMNFTFLWHFWTIFSPFIRRRIIDICFWRFITQFFTTFASLCASFKFLGPEIEISLFQFRSSAHCKDSSKSGWELYGGSCAYLLLHKYWKEVLSFSFIS